MYMVVEWCTVPTDLYSLEVGLSPRLRMKSRMVHSISISYLISQRVYQDFMSREVETDEIVYRIIT